MQIFFKFKEFTKIFDRLLLFLSCKFYRMSHFRSIDSNSLQSQIERIFKCLIYNDFPVKTPSPIYFKPRISFRCRYKMFYMLFGKLSKPDSDSLQF